MNLNSENTPPNAAPIDPGQDRVLVTGGAGFIGSRVVKKLFEQGFRNVVCLSRPSGKLGRLEEIKKTMPAGASLEVVQGNLLRAADCESACKNVSVILHLAAGTGEKSTPDAYMNTVVATRNLLEAVLRTGRLKRFVLVSSFAVYSNCDKPKGRLLDESCPVDPRPETRAEAYSFAKVKQEELLESYGKERGVPYVILRPGSVYGEEHAAIAGRVGIGTFGIFLHVGGSNKIPFTYVENCADAIVRAGYVPGINGEAFNIVDDDLPSSRQFLRRYKREVRRFKSLYVPHFASYAFCYLWEKYSHWSEGQLPPVFNRSRWHAYWKKTRYSNAKLKQKLGWNPSVSTAEAMTRYFQSLRKGGQHA